MAGKINNETLALNIDINGGDKVRKEMNDLNRAIQDTKTEIAELTQKQKELAAQGKKDTAAYKAVTKSIEEKNRGLEQSKTKLAALERQQSVSSMTISELNKRIRELNSVLSKIDPKAPEWKQVNGELKEAKTRMKELRAQSQATGGTLRSMMEGLNKYVNLFAVGAHYMRRFLDMAGRVNDRWLAYDEALTDAMKTTNLTRGEVEELGEELGKLDTRTSRNDLLELARIGGKLGITGKENILEFVRAADQINVALGRDLGDNTEDAIREIGKLVDIFDLQEEYGLERSMLKVGSAINELGMASTANEGYIVDFTKRLAGVAPNADIAIEDVLGMAATLDKYGQMTETSSTAITQVITGMFRKTATFAGVAKMPVEDFTRLLKEDVNEAFVRVLEGMKQGAGGMLEVTAALDSLQLDGQRATTVLGSLAHHSEELRRQQELAKQAFDEGTSTTNEFGIKNSSATAEVEKLRNALHDASVDIGRELNPVLTTTTSVSTLFVKALGKLIAFAVRYRGVLLGLVSAYVSYLAMKNAHIVRDKALALWQTATISRTALETKSIAGATKATLAWSAAKYALTGHFRAAAVAARAFFASLGPIGWASIVIGGLVSSFGFLKRAIEGVSEAEQVRIDIEKGAREVMDENGVSLKEKAARITTYLERINDANTSEAVRLSYIRELNALLPEEIGHIDEKGEAIGRLTQKIKAYRDLLDVQSDKESAMRKRDSLIADYDASVASGENKKTKGFWQKAGDEISLYMAASAGRNVRAEAQRRIAARNAEAAKTTFDKKLSAAEKAIADLEAKENELLAIVYGKSSGGTYGESDSWSLDSDAEFIKKRTELRNKYAKGEILTEEELNEQISDLETEFLNRRLKTLQDIITERTSLQNEVNTRLAAAEGRSLTDKEQREIDSLNSRIESMRNAENEILKIEDELADRSVKKRTQRDAEKYESDSWSLDRDESFLRERAELRERYAQGEFSNESQLAEEIEKLELQHLERRRLSLESSVQERARLQEEITGLNLAETEHGLTEEERLYREQAKARAAELEKACREQAEIEDQIAERRAKQRARRDAERLQAGRRAAQKAEEVERLKEETELNAAEREEQRYKRELAKYKDNAAALELVEKKHQRNLTKIRLDEIEHRLSSEESNYRLERKKMVDDHKKDLQTHDYSPKKRREVIQDFNKNLLTFDTNYLNKMKTQLEGLIGSGIFEGIELDTGLISDEEMRKFKEQLQEIYTLINGGEAADNNGSRRKKKGGSLFGVSQEEWEGFFNGDFDTGAFIDALQGMVSEAMNIYSMWADKQAAVERKLLKEYKENNDKKKSALEDRLNAGLMTEAQYNAEVEALDAQYEAYEEEMELKQAKRQKAQKISEAVINTALGVSKTLAEWGIPWGLAPAAVMAAMGAAQIAIIAKTPVMTGMAEGGLFDVVREQDGRRFPARLSPERRGFIDRPTVLVGEAGGEYVIPAEGLANPTLAPLIATIEGARRNGTLKSLNMEAVYPATMPIPGRAEGGYTGTVPKTKADSGGDIDPRMAAVLEKLLKRLDDPVKAYVSVLGKNGIKEAYDKYENHKNRGRL